MNQLIKVALITALAESGALAQTNTNAVATNTPPSTEVTNAPSKFRSPDDGWFDIGGFLQEKYGFLPIPIIITEPAIGYGGGVGLTFLSKPLPNAEAGLGRPNISTVGAFGTENGTWGVFAGDLRQWFDEHLQTMVGVAHASANLKFYGVGDEPVLTDNPLHYTLEPTIGVMRAKYRFGDSRIWAGLNYAFSSTRVTFDAPPGTPGEPAFQHESKVGGFTPSLTFDTRDNFFTPKSGTYLEATAGLFSPSFGSDNDFQRANLVAMQFVPLSSKLFLGVRADGAASFGDEPFYLRPYISLRGAPALRYQGDEIAQIEAELRWQFWERFSVVGFTGTGAAWNSAEHFNNSQTIVTGGTGFRYEIARSYGLHVGVDVAVSPHDTAIYLQIGSSWARP